MSLRRATAMRFFIFQKDSENLDGLERLVGRVHQLQYELRVRIDESKAKGFVWSVICAHSLSLPPSNNCARLQAGNALRVLSGMAHRRSLDVRLARADSLLL